MRDGNTAGFFRIIGKIGLGIHIGVVTDNFDSAFVGPYGSVGPKAPEFALHGAFRRHVQAVADIQ